MKLLEFIKDLFLGPTRSGGLATHDRNLNDAVTRGQRFADEARKARENPELLEEADKEINEAIDRELELEEISEQRTNALVQSSKSKQ